MKFTLCATAVGLVLASVEIADAQSKCDASKLKEYGKKVLCLAKVDAKAAKKGEAVDTAKEQSCIDKFAEKCARAEGQDDCTGAVKSCAELMTEADVCRDGSVGSGGPTTTTLPVNCGGTFAEACSFGTCPPGQACSWNQTVFSCLCIPQESCSSAQCIAGGGNGPGNCGGSCPAGYSCGEIGPGIYVCGGPACNEDASCSCPPGGFCMDF